MGVRPLVEAGRAGVGIRRSRRFAACASIGRAEVALRATRVLYAAGTTRFDDRPLVRA